MSSVSKLARNGSHTSITSSGSSVDMSSHNHLLNSIRSGPPSLRTWLQESWEPITHRHERIATGTMSMGVAVLTQEMMGMHGIQQAPEIRSMLDCLPITTRSGELGFKQKLRTWPMSKQETLRQKFGTWPLTKTEVLLANEYPVQPIQGN